ncbi:hypothetical protein T10_1991 [Trichinella papuae]|uniref:Apple domain-containing protein n=1 Tax=Trichinella papuae TaxID=268474 RepID=A0A0V1MZA7_9BILA|nr:hypothetical protein T10_1991 [Trichinella papuae]
MSFIFKIKFNVCVMYQMSVSYAFTVFLLIILKQALMLHIKLYVPKLDKICELESQNLDATPIQDNKLFHFNSTFEHCISIVYATIHQGGFNVFSYNKETAICAGYRSYSFPFNASISTLENEVPLFYVLIDCNEVGNNSHLQESNVEEENVNRFLNISIIALHEKCTILRLPFSENFQAKRLSLTFPNTFTMCLGYCRTYMKDLHCNAVLQSSAENTCLLLQLDNKFNNNTKIMKSTSQLYFLMKCEYDTTPDATDPEFLNLEATNATNVYKVFVQHSNMHCELIKLPLLAKYEKNRIALWAAGTFETCVWFCSPPDEVENICNAVYYSSEEESCLHLKISAEDVLSNISANAIRSPFIFYIKDCQIASETGEREVENLDSDFGESSSSSSSSSLSSADEMIDDDISVSRGINDSSDIFGEENVESSLLELVNLHTYYEVCIIQRLNITLLNNVFVSNISHPVRFLNQCLHFCRATYINQGCRGVSFLREERSCQMLFRGSDQLPVNQRAEIVRLLGCLKDRERERRGNPDALMYFFQELMLACLIEPYKNTSLRYWKKLREISGVESFQQCLLICVKEPVPSKCHALNYSESKNCILLQRGSYTDNYTVPPRSVFAAVLFCEPGSIVDLLHSS